MSWIREPNSEPIPGYRLLEPLGSGGFGEVWKCEAPGGIHKAIKFVYGNFNSLDVDSVRAEQERKALQRIKEVRHPFVCSLDRIEEVEGELVIVMELAERTLHDVFQECVTAGLIGIPRDQLLRYLADAAEALDHMIEGHGLQHLDVKPKNLFLISNRVKVADFGLVKQLESQRNSGLVGGVTPLYAAPETFVGKISQHSDQYSLAIVYQELLTGQRPFTGKNVRQLASQHMQDEPDLRSLPEIERPIVARALAKDPSKRFPNNMAFITALYKARTHAKVDADHRNGHAVSAKELVGAGRVKAETMQDIQLEDYNAPSSVVDLAAPPPPRRDEDDNLLSDMGMTIPAPDTGALRPTLIVGLGAFGRKAMLELRCRFIDRFGELNKLSLLRFLYIDTDPDASQSAARGAPEVALSRGDYYPLPLQPVVKYRQRNLDQLGEWLPREKLYAMPRSMQTQGSRALGRLAFSDNQQRLVARLRREIQEITNPDAIYQTVTQTGLALRDNTPRVYILAAAGGGASGMIPDLGYAIRRLLAHLRHPDAKVHAFLLCGAPQDPATPKSESANVYATLTELNHFSDPNIAFAAQYGVDGQRIVDQGQPFNSVYLLPQPHRSPDALEGTIAQLGNYLFHELTTPLGLRLDNIRHEMEFHSGSRPGMVEAPMRSFGTFSVWFPRGLLLRRASRQACRSLIDSWLSERIEDLSETARMQVLEVQQRLTSEPGLLPEAIADYLETTPQAGTPTEPGNTPGEVLAGMLTKLGEQVVQSVAQEDPGNWARQAVNRVRDWIGSGEAEGELHDWRKTRMTRTLSAAAQKAAEHWDNVLTKEIFGLMELPGARVAAAEAALQQVHTFCLQMAQAQNQAISQQATRSTQAWKGVDEALYECTAGAGGFRLFGGRSRGRQLRTFVEQLSHFARQRLAEEVHGAVKHFYTLLAGRLAERGRDLGFCRQRLRHLQESLEQGAADADEDLTSTRPGADYTLTRSPIPSTDTFWEAIRQSATARVVLPDQEQDPERAALRFLQGLQRDQWVQLDQELNERLLQPLGGLHNACTGSADLSRQLALPLVEETANLLGQHLPIMDVAQILGEEMNRAEADGSDLNGQVKDYLERAQPLLGGKREDQHYCFLLTPGSPMGKTLGETVALTFPDIKQVRVAGQAELMFCREQGALTAADLQKVLKSSRAAYESLAFSPNTSPHARFDISDWLPLDP